MRGTRCSQALALRHFQEDSLSLARFAAIAASALM